MAQVYYNPSTLQPYTGQVYNNDGNGTSGTFDGSGNQLSAYDSSQAASPAQAELDGVQPGLYQTVTSMGLDPTQAATALYNYQYSTGRGLNDVGSIGAALSAIGQGGYAAATPAAAQWISQNQGAYTQGQAFMAKAQQEDNPAMSMHESDYQTMAEGIGLIAGAGAIGGAFGGAGLGAGGSGFTAGMGGADGLGGLGGGVGASTGLNAAGGIAAGDALDAGGGLASTTDGSIIGGGSGGGIAGGGGGGALAAQDAASGIPGLSNSDLASLAPTSDPLAAGASGTTGGLLTPGGATASQLQDLGTLAPGSSISSAGTGSQLSQLMSNIGSGNFSGALNNAGSLLTPSPSNLISSAINYFSNQNLSSSLNNIANTVATTGQTANNPEAVNAYNTFMNYVNNPSQYINNQGAPISAQILQGVPAAIAKTGNFGNVIANAGTNIAGALSQNYNGFLSTLAGETGLGQSAAPAAVGAGTLAAQGALVGAAGTNSLGSLANTLLKNNSSNTNTATGSGPFGTTFS